MDKSYKPLIETSVHTAKECRWIIPGIRKMDDTEFNQAEFVDFVYKPPGECKSVALDATMGVKFSNDIFLMKSFLDQHKIEYKIEDLENGPMGWVLRIKKDG